MNFSWCEFVNKLVHSSFQNIYSDRVRLVCRLPYKIISKLTLSGVYGSCGQVTYVYFICTPYTF